MTLFLAFVILLNSAAMIAAGYLLWNLHEIFKRQLVEAIRKQDDRLRKRFGVPNGVTTAEETSTEEKAASGDLDAAKRPAQQAGRPFRRR